MNSNYPIVGAGYQFYVNRMLGIMQTCLWPSIGAPGKAQLRRRVDSPSGNGSVWVLEATKGGVGKPLLLRVPVGTRARYSLPVAPRSWGLPTAAVTCLQYSEHP